MMQNPLTNKKELNSFIKDENANKLNVRHSHPDRVSAVSQDFSVAFRITPKGLTASLCEQTINIDEPVLLKSVDIDKPWGREIWYTCIEERGESRVKTGEDRSIPLSLYLSLTPDHISNNLLPLLLKVLAPLPAEPEGNLYFEIHEKKKRSTLSRISIKIPGQMVSAPSDMGSSRKNANTMQLTRNSSWPIWKQ